MNYFGTTGSSDNRMKTCKYSLKLFLLFILKSLILSKLVASLKRIEFYIHCEFWKNSVAELGIIHHAFSFISMWMKQFSLWHFS